MFLIKRAALFGSATFLPFVMDSENLNELRKQIDKVDGEICSLLKARFCLCEKIKAEKNLSGLNITDKTRESAVYEHIGGLFDCEKQKNAAKNIYKEIIKNCKEIQK